MRLAFVLALVAVASAMEFQDFKACYSSPLETIDCIETSPRPDSYVDMESLPASFDWRNYKGVNYVTAVLNQHIPKYCGACWAFNTLSALSDRIKIQRQAAWPEVSLSPQVLLNCAQAKGFQGSCNGGFAHSAYSFVEKYGITDSSCAPYQAQCLSCSRENTCKSCAHDGTCNAVANPTKYFVKEFGQVKGEKSMMAEIQERGPIACGIAVTKDLFEYNGGIFKDNTGDKAVRHLISVVGWGEEDGQKYWIVRNSWGSYWGEQGFLRLARGINNLNIENDCYWATPSSPSNSFLERGLTQSLESDDGDSDADGDEADDQESPDSRADDSQADEEELMKIMAQLGGVGDAY